MSESKTTETVSASPSAADAQVKKRILGIFAHPDDPEFHFGGTAARWSAEGHYVIYCLVTNGDKGGGDNLQITSEELVALREREQRAAAQAAGVQEVIFLGHPDGVVEHDLGLRREICSVIRATKPDVIVCGDPTTYWFGNSYINHPDHRAVAEAALAGMFPAAGNRLYFPELLEQGLEPHSVDELYMSTDDSGETIVDITAYIDRKVAALREHASQMGDWDFESMIRDWASRDGNRHDPPVEYGESFRYFSFDHDEG